MIPSRLTRLGNMLYVTRFVRIARLSVRSGNILARRNTRYGCFSYTEHWRQIANTCKPPHAKLDSFRYERLADETLERLTEEFEHWFGREDFKGDFDNSLSNGVLTIVLEGIGTYVINKQSANQQIWLSSPFSGPKRYDYLNGQWVYAKDNVTLDTLLSRELSIVLKSPVKINLDLHSQ